MSVSTAQATTLLENVLFESPTLAAANAAHWANVNTDGTSPAIDTVDLSNVAAEMAATPEIGIAEQVIRYYEGFLGRIPTGAEVSFYTSYAETGLSASLIASEGAAAVTLPTWGQIAGFFTASPEFAQGSLAMAGANLIGDLYSQILGRTPSAAETAFYQGLLNQGTTIPTLVQYFVNSHEYVAKVDATLPQSLASYGFDVTVGDRTGAQTVVTTHGPLTITINTAGANYATAPNLTLNGVFPGVAIGIADSSPLTVDGPATISSTVTSLAGVIAQLETALPAHTVVSGVYQGNTYVVESKTGVLGPTDTTVIELTGVHILASTTPAGVITVLA